MIREIGRTRSEKERKTPHSYYCEIEQTLPLFIEKGYFRCQCVIENCELISEQNSKEHRMNGKLKRELKRKDINFSI